MTLNLSFYCFKSEQQNAPLEAGLGNPQGEIQQALQAAGLNEHCFSSVLRDLYLQGRATLVGMQNVLGSKTPCWNISQF